MLFGVADKGAEVHDRAEKEEGIEAEATDALICLRYVVTITGASCTSMLVYIAVCKYIYIYIYRNKEKERERLQEDGGFATLAFQIVGLSGHVARSWNFVFPAKLLPAESSDATVF
jgi:amino acid transporter